MEPWVPGLIAGGFAVIVAIASGVVTGMLTARRERRARDHASGAPGAPTVQQVWERQDKMERALGASLTIIGELVEQHDNKGNLRVSPSAIRILRETDYMPTELEDVLYQNESNKNKE